MGENDTPAPPERIDIRIDNKSVLDLTYDPARVEVSLRVGVTFLGGGGGAPPADMMDLAASAETFGFSLNVPPKKKKAYPSRPVPPPSGTS